MKNCPVFLFAAALLATTTSASAVTLAHWVDDSTQTPVNNEYEIGDVVPHTPFIYSSSSYSWYARANNGGASDPTGGSDLLPTNLTGTTAEIEAAAVSANSYVEFSLTAVEGYQIDISSVTLTVALQSLGGTDYPATDAISANAFLRSSLDGYSSTIGTVDAAIGPRAAGQDTVSQYSTLTASSLGSEYSTITGTVTFRVYYYIDTAQTDYQQVVRADNISIVGDTSAIPEPATVGLLGGAFALALLLFARRRR